MRGSAKADPLIVFPECIKSVFAEPIRVAFLTPFGQKPHTTSINIIRGYESRSQPLGLGSSWLALSIILLREREDSTAQVIQLIGPPVPFFIY